MPKRLGLGFLVLSVSINMLFTGCSSRSHTIESLETRLTALEDDMYNFQARQESVNQWESSRLKALEAKHPEIKVPNPPPVITRETMRPGPSEQEKIQAASEAVTPKPGEAVVAPSALPQAAAATSVQNKGVVIYHTPASITLQPPRSGTSSTGQAAAQPPVAASNQPRAEISGGRPIDPASPPAPLKAGEQKPAPKAGTSPKVPASSGGEKGEYASALAQIERERLSQGRAAMDGFMAKYPSSSLVPNALYWKGEAYYSEKKYDEAILSFKEIISRFPKSGKAPDALLKTGMSYQKMGDSQNAKFYLQLLLSDYPSSRSAGIAKKQMAGLPN